MTISAGTPSSACGMQHLALQFTGSKLHSYNISLILLLGKMAATTPACTFAAPCHAYRSIKHGAGNAARSSLGCLNPSMLHSRSFPSLSMERARPQVAVAAAKSKKKGQQKSSKPRKKAAPDPNACPCGSNKPYEGCCGIIHAEGAALAEVSAKDLMRARFTAYAKGLPQFVVDSTHPDCPLEVEFKQEDGSYGPGFLEEATKFCEDYEFSKLSIIQSTVDEEAGEAKVLFKVWYRLRMATGVQETMTEHSLFRRVDGQWLYYDRLA